MHGVLLVLVAALAVFAVDHALAHPHQIQADHVHYPEIELVPLSATTALEKSTVPFHAPSDNLLPWGYVEGKVTNHVEGYPVIIHIVRGDDAVHFAQTDLDENGAYEYRFRVLSAQDGDTTRIFEGDYTVNIFKVVYLDEPV